MQHDKEDITVSDNLATVDDAKAPPTATPDQNQRDEMVKGLRRLADFLDLNRVPLPRTTEVSRHFDDHDEYDTLIASYHFEKLRGWGGPGYDTACLSFGPVSYRIQTRSDPGRKLAERERKVAEREAALRDREAALETAA